MLQISIAFAINYETASPKCRIDNVGTENIYNTHEGTKNIVAFNSRSLLY